MRIERAGESLWLSGERAVIWPARRTVIVADTHFGKDGVFRSAGVAIPSGMSSFDLARLTRLIERHGIERLVVLGDFFHGAPHRSGDFAACLDAWLTQHPALRVDIVAGNHDRHGGHGFRPDRLNWHADELLDPPFTFAHQPCLARARSAARSRGYVLCGHIHPMLVMHSHSGDRARVPIFWFCAAHAVLPAFGIFTGGENVRPADEDDLYAVAAHEVIAIRAPDVAQRTSEAPAESYVRARRFSAS